ncbi:sodium:proton exchanger [Mycobacterium intracellulare subsp. chimaera]|uniref:sodium:proton exchanger n=1 Tax=Mycobacterium intracellulare TaxID=1767 RepID=UPI002599DCF2|nr:sodium:proton exchanger [Mycobacterium intracellulare]MDM3904306.1 sodium:proton exchanger [Mycobacterium intracellulare subsp. chimaera]
MPNDPEVDGILSGRAAILRVGIAGLAAAPAVAFRATSGELAAPAAVLVFGTGVLAAVALLMWAAEAARADVSGSLALAVLAVVAILPEYAVDIYFAYSAGRRPDFAAYATANMTGANRLLIGVAWPLLVFTAIWAIRRRRSQEPGETVGEPTGWLRGGVGMADQRRVEILFLAAATLYALVIPLTGRLAWYDSIALGGLFAAYLWRIRDSPDSEEELTGVAAIVAAQPRIRRRSLVVLLFAAAAVIILASAEPFGDALVDAGTELGVDRFLLVQWLAPIASESPEVLVAITFALRARADDGMGALLAAKLNQWALLVACLPIAYYIGGGHLAGLPMDARQTEEFVLTTAQTVLGVAMLLTLRLTGAKALLLLGLFVAQFALPDEQARYIISAVYIVVAVVFAIRYRNEVRPLLAAGSRRRSQQPLAQRRAT